MNGSFGYFSYFTAVFANALFQTKCVFILTCMFFYAAIAFISFEMGGTLHHTIITIQKNRETHTHTLKQHVYVHTVTKRLLPMVKLKPSMLKVALRHFLNPCFLDVGSVIVALDAHSSALCQSADECGEQSTFPGEE